MNGCSPCALDNQNYQPIIMTFLRMYLYFITVYPGYRKQVHCCSYPNIKRSLFYLHQQRASSPYFTTRCSRKKKKKKEEEEEEVCAGVVALLLLH